MTTNERITALEKAVLELQGQGGILKKIEVHDTPQKKARGRPSNHSATDSTLPLLHQVYAAWTAETSVFDRE